MSARPVSIAAPDPAAGFYGKVPTAGDFIARRVSRDSMSRWDDWLQHGLYRIRNASALAASGARQHRTPIWNFAVPPGVAGEPLIGLIGASCDRVGRRFPFTLFMPHAGMLPRDLRLERLNAFFVTHGGIMRNVQLGRIDMEKLERALRQAGEWRSAIAASDGVAEGEIFAVLNEPSPGTPSPWPGLTIGDILSGDFSYWWTNPASGGTPRSFTHHGALNDALIETLLSAT
jgi:type VI secretion system protein ImpM